MNINFSQYSILVVEDSKISLFLLRDLLENDGFKVFTAEHANEANTILMQEKIDLILMDVMMSDKSGFEFTQELKSIQQYKDIPIIFITALNSIEYIVRGFDLGGVDYATKPFRKEELSRRVKQQIKLIHSQRVILRQKEELEEVITNRDWMYAIMAHDLRSPISSLKMILNMLSLQDNAFPSDPEYQKMLYSGNDIVEQLFCMLDNLLKWTKSNLGMQSYIAQEFDLDETVLGVIEVLMPTAKLKNIIFESELETGVGVEFDIDVMKSILRNLLINALKFSYADSTVSVKLRAEGNYAIFEVIDTGMGMNEQVQRDLLEGVRGRSHLGTANEKGAGLGLWIVQHFIQGNRGEFFFESKENKGSRFGLKIPRISK